MIDLASIVKQLWESYASMPWLGALIVAFLGNVVPFATIPYLFVIIATAPAYKTPLEQIGVILGAGLGAALGKLVVFMFGKVAHAALPEEMRRNLEIFVRLLRRWGFLAVFLFAALPLPDDVLYIPLGVAGYSIAWFFLGVLLGKIVITAAALAMGNFVAMLVGAEGRLNLVYIIVMLVLSIYVTVVIARVDWMRVARAMEKGLMPTIQVLVEELGRAAIPLPLSHGNGREVHKRP